MRPYLIAVCLLACVFALAATADAGCKGPACPLPRAPVVQIDRAVLAVPVVASVVPPVVDRVLDRAVGVVQRVNQNRPHLLRRTLVHVRCRLRCG